MSYYKFELWQNSEGNKYTLQFTSTSGKGNWEWEGGYEAHDQENDKLVSSYTITEKEYKKSVKKFGQYTPSFREYGF